MISQAAGTETMMHRYYDDLRRIARNRMRAEGRISTIHPTELVHEAFLKLGHNPKAVWDDRVHFFGSAARAMRQVLSDRARKRKASKNGGASARLPWELASGVVSGSEPDWEAVDAVFEKLASRDARAAQIVDLHCFCGLSVQETAEALGFSPSTVTREWSYAKAWISREIAKIE